MYQDHMNKMKLNRRQLMYNEHHLITNRIYNTQTQLNTCRVSFRNCFKEVKMLILKKRGVNIHYNKGV